LTNSETEIVSVLNAGLHLIREDIPFEGNKVYVTIPDKYCQSVLVPLDPELTENDGWEFARWTINNRWQTENSHEYFGRLFEGKQKSAFAIRVSTIFTEPIKLAIQELGGEALWMGTESSAFFGLYPEKGCTVFHPESNGYRYFHYSQDSFQNGTARFIKENWRLHPFTGSKSDKDAFKGQLIFAGKLSEKRKANFKGRRIKQLVALHGIGVEGDIIPKDIKEEDIYCLTSIVKGTVQGVALNFFDNPGLQKYQYAKPIPSEKPEIDLPKPGVKKPIEKKPKPKKKKKKRNLLQSALYLFFFSSIAIMIAYDQKPELFDAIPKITLGKPPKVEILPPIEIVGPTPEIEEVLEEEKPDYLVNSQNLIWTALRTLELSDSYKIMLLSLSGGRMDLELVGNKTMDAPIDSLGDVLNYSLRQVNGDNQFKHGYLVNYQLSDHSDIQTDFSLEEFKLFITSLDQSYYKEIDPIEREDRTQMPIIVRTSGTDNIDQILLKLSLEGKNLAVEKFVYAGDSEKNSPSAVFYVSLYFQLQPESQE